MLLKRQLHDTCYYIANTTSTYDVHVTDGVTILSLSASLYTENKWGQGVSMSNRTKPIITVYCV